MKRQADVRPSERATLKMSLLALAGSAVILIGCQNHDAGTVPGMSSEHTERSDSVGSPGAESQNRNAEENDSGSPASNSGASSSGGSSGGSGSSSGSGG